MHDYRELAQDYAQELAKLGKEMPDTMAGFSQMSKAANKSGALDEIQKELIAMAIGVAGRCQGCLTFHAKALVKLGCSRGAFIEMLQVAVYMGGGPSLMTAAEALKAFDDFSAE